ncbi:MAG: hypothetical protein ABEL76_11145, partial [Bradymonadaceae bacterium]
MADESQTFEHPADGSKYASAYIAGVGGGAAVMLIVVLAFATVGVSGPMVVAAGGAVWLAVGLALFALLRPSPIEVRREGEVVWIDGEELSVGTGEVRVEQSSS